MRKNYHRKLTEQGCGSDRSRRQYREEFPHFHSRSWGFPHSATNSDRPNPVCSAAAYRANHPILCHSPRIPKELQEIRMQKLQQRIQSFIPTVGFHTQLSRKRPSTNRNRSIQPEMPKMRQRSMARPPRRMRTSLFGENQ